MIRPSGNCEDCGKFYEELWHRSGDLTPRAASFCITCSMKGAPSRAADRPKRKPKDPLSPPPLPEGGLLLSDDGRLCVRYSGEAAYWLRDEIGRGRLAGFFVRDGRLVHTPREGADGYVPADPGNDDGPAQVQLVNHRRLTAIVQLTYQVYRIEGFGDDAFEHDEIFPLPAAQIVTSAPDMCPNLRPLVGVTHTPVLRADGTVLATPGYDEATRLLYMPAPGLVVPAVATEPTAEDVSAAVALLGEMVAGFPWAGKHDKANYLGLLLTPLLREIVPGARKMFGINAHQPGSGKTLLGTLVRIIHGGVLRAEMPGSEDELKKVVTSILMNTTGPVIHIDNVSGTLRSATLAGLLTSRVWTERVLGGQDMPVLANDRVWMLTGNNLALGTQDLVRRTINIGIDPGMPNPETRTGFAITDLETWTEANRGRLIGALLTLVRAWVVAGRPLQQREQSDSYAPWECVVGGILAHAGVDGEFDAPESREAQSSVDEDEWGGFLATLEREFGEAHFTARDVVNRIAWVPNGGIPQRTISVDELPSAMEAEPHRLPRVLGNWLRNRKGRFCGPLAVRLSPRPKTANGVLWYVERHGPRPPAANPFGPPAGTPD